MEKIDTALQAEMIAKPDSKLDVLISYTGAHDGLVSALGTLGITTGNGLLPLGILTATMTAAQISEIAARQDDETIALDEDASTQ